MIAIAFHFAVKEPGKEFTALQVADSLGVSKNTARGYLKKLVEEDLLVLASTKRVRTVRYLAPANLREYSVSQINKVHLTTCGNPLRGFDDGWTNFVRPTASLWRDSSLCPTFSERRCPPGHAGRLSLSLASPSESRQAPACPPGCESPLCLLSPFSCLKTIGFVLHQNENCYN